MAYRESAPRATVVVPWDRARAGLLLVGVEHLVAGALVLVGAAGVAIDGTGRTKLAAVAAIGQIVVACFYPVGIALFARGCLLPGTVKPLLVATALVAAAIPARTVLSNQSLLPDLAPRLAWAWTALPLIAAAGSVGSILLLATAWGLEYRLRYRATGWPWLFAVAVVVSMTMWRLPQELRPSSPSYTPYAISWSASTLVSYLITAAAPLVVAFPCLRLRRTLGMAPGALAPSPPPPVRRFQLHAAALEAKLALAVVLAVVASLPRLPWLDTILPALAWERIFWWGDLALDVAVLVIVMRGARDAGGWQLLVISALVRVALVVLPPELHAAVESMAVIASILGHARLATWNAAALGPLVREPARAGYRDATRMLVGALLVFGAASLALHGPGPFVLVALPTAIVAVVLLRQHERRALGVLDEASAGSTG